MSVSKLVCEVFDAFCVEFNCATSFKKQDFKEIFVFDDKENVYFSHATDKSKNFKVKRGDAQAMLTKLAELEQQKQKKEYQKLLENGNGNNNH